MSRFNLADIPSSTLIFATDSLDEVAAIVQTLVQRDGLSSLDDVSLSVQTVNESEYVDFSASEIVRVLMAMQAEGVAASRS